MLSSMYAPERRLAPIHCMSGPERRGCQEARSQTQAGALEGTESVSASATRPAPRASVWGVTRFTTRPPPSISSADSRTTMLSLGTLIYVALLLINAMAVLSEDRFLARSTLGRSAQPESLLTGFLFSLSLSWLVIRSSPACCPTIRATVRPVRVHRSGRWSEGAAHQSYQRRADAHAE